MKNDHSTEFTRFARALRNAATYVACIGPDGVTMEPRAGVDREQVEAWIRSEWEWVEQLQGMTLGDKISAVLNG